MLGLLGAIAAAAGIVRVASDDPPAAPSAEGRSQSTVLFQIRGTDRAAAASALLAHDPETARGVVLLVPGRVISPIPGRGQGAFSSALEFGPPSLSAAALGDLIGVTVDGSVVMDTATFASFVDRLGGITVDVDADVLQRAGNGELVVLVPEGEQQQLDGAAATAYATYAGGGQLQQMARLQRVVDGVVAQLNDADEATLALRDLGAGAQLEPDAALAARVLAGIAAADINVDYQTLPVTPVEATGADTYRLDRAASLEFVRRTLGESIPEGLRTGGNAVWVSNGVGTPQLGASTRDKLLRAGFVYLDGGNVPGFPYRGEPSIVAVPSRSADDIARGQRVARALGLPESAVQVSTRGQSVADVFVYLGRDYKP